MRSALYYPYTSIDSEALIRTSLLLWDHVQIMVPWDGFLPNYANRDHARAIELIGRVARLLALFGIAGGQPFRAFFGGECA